MTVDSYIYEVLRESDGQSIGFTILNAHPIVGDRWVLEMQELPVGLDQKTWTLEECEVISVDRKCQWMWVRSK